MIVDTTFRSNAPEIMDDFSIEGEILKDALDKIAAINKLLGGNKVTLLGVKELIKNKSKNETVTILDVGCGNGDMLRTLAEYATNNGLKFNLVGIDANQFTIDHAQTLSINYPNITYSCDDIFKNNLKEGSFDIVLCTLTLHHFKDPDILKLLNDFYKTAKLGIVINDLHRSRLAYYLFKVICYLFGLNEMSREDGLVSILRGFKKSDLLLYSRKLNFKKYSIRWKWAFRYQWVIKSI